MTEPTIERLTTSAMLTIAATDRPSLTFRLERAGTFSSRPLRVNASACEMDKPLPGSDDARVKFANSFLSNKFFAIAAPVSRIFSGFTIQGDLPNRQGMQPKVIELADTIITPVAPFPNGQRLRLQLASAYTECRFCPQVQP